MAPHKTLSTILLGSVLSLGNNSCRSNRHLEYHFEGKIEGDSVEFYETGAGDNVLLVTFQNGNRITYIDYDNDMEVDHVKVRVGTNTTEYYKYNRKNPDPVSVETLKMAQQQFDAYLKKITEIQTAPLQQKKSSEQ
ncbi:hypothetical protein HZB03_04945 [Candidatus Woesearchaeota archaeon]|nr:hypothetical protein [Candidatus Woesearchaeota archaeon]